MLKSILISDAPNEALYERREVNEHGSHPTGTLIVVDKNNPVAARWRR